MRVSWIPQNDNSKLLNVSHDFQFDKFVYSEFRISSNELQSHNKRPRYFHNLWRYTKRTNLENRWRIYSNEIPPINPILIKRAAVQGEKSPIKSNNAGAKHIITGLCFFHYTLCLALKHPFEGERPPERIARTQVSRKELHRKNGAAKEVEIWNGGRHEVWV